ncbi:MAG: IclR family transcriptional regulator, partial [Betaproteobacteria bacterium]|nr:IclR family transcriptional regulator [Betaproteobacteria bacterium]
AEIAQAGLPTLWPEFRRYFASIRKAGYYLSHGELESTLSALAVPLVAGNGRVMGALSLVSSVQRMAVVDTSKLTPLLQRAASDIGSRLQ